MTGFEFENTFDVLYNNITSNQAPGLNSYEKSVFLTKAQDELIKNYFNPNSNPKHEGFDNTPKRQMDFSLLMRTHGAYPQDPSDDVGGSRDEDPSERGASSYDPRGKLYALPSDLFIPINESVRLIVKTYDYSRSAVPVYTTKKVRQVIPISFEDYTRQMSKPYKEPLKNQAWRLLVDNTKNLIHSTDEGKLAEIVVGHNDLKWLSANVGETRLMQYMLRYIKKPKPILVAPIDSFGVSISGHDGHYTSEFDYDRAYKYSADHTEILNPCELDESLHEEILQRAVELAKVSWTATGQDNAQMVLQAGQRSE